MKTHNRHCERPSGAWQSRLDCFVVTLLAMTLLVLAACAGNYKTPGVAKDPSKMSADTLCFRYASAKDPALGAEIERRGLDCTALLRDDPLYSGPDESVYRMGR